eukprot:SAG11_NODE_2156_length_3734_cov_22.964787_3_plen_217_part_00
MGRYFDQQDYLEAKLQQQESRGGGGWTFTAWRPPAVIGFALGAPLSCVAAVGWSGSITAPASPRATLPVPVWLPRCGPTAEPALSLAPLSQVKGGGGFVGCFCFAFVLATTHQCIVAATRRSCGSSASHWLSLVRWRSPSRPAMCGCWLRHSSGLAAPVVYCHRSVHSRTNTLPLQYAAAAIRCRCNTLPLQYAAAAIRCRCNTLPLHQYAAIANL